MRYAWQLDDNDDHTLEITDRPGYDTGTVANHRAYPKICHLPQIFTTVKVG